MDRVGDGDTLTAMTANNTNLRIRFLDVDAPEIANGQKLGQRSGEENRDGFDDPIGCMTG